MQEDNYKFEKLNDRVNVCVSKDHRFGTDAFLLAYFAKPKKTDLVCDLGTGCGIIPMIFSKHKCPPKKIYGVDIQPQAIEQFELSIKNSQVSNELIPVRADLKELSDMEFGQFNLVTCNPPYKADRTGILSETSSDKIARHETMCTIFDICKTAKRLLQFNGRLCMCQRPERLMDVMDAMRQNGIEPKRLQFVAKEEGCAPWLFLIEGKKSAKPFLQVMPEFYLYKDGEYTDQMLNVYQNED